jgi:hypothetical protein
MNYQTCYALIKREYYETRNLVFWLFLLTLILLFIHTVPNILVYDIDLLNGSKIIYMVIGGIIASYTFWEFKSASNIRSYLLIPANPIEKLTAKIIFYVVGWLMLFILCLLIANIVIFSKMLFLTNQGVPGLVVLNVAPALFQSFLQVLLIQSIAIFASCYFKRRVLIKSLCVYIIMILPFKYIHNILYTFNQKYFPNSNSLLIVVKICLILALWFITWLRLKETEGL